MGSHAGAVLGINCTLQSSRLRQIVETVLRQIGKRYPSDLSTLQKKVLALEPLGKHELVDGTIGHAIPVRPPELDDLAELWRSATTEEEVLEVVSLERTENWPRRIRIWDGPYDDDVRDWYLRALVAHEFGHAATRSADADRRCGIDSEWGAEASAEYLAYKWGFGRDCGRARKTRVRRHHGPGPGQVVEIYGKRYRMTRGFYLLEITSPANRKPKRRRGK